MADFEIKIKGAHFLKNLSNLKEGHIRDGVRFGLLNYGNVLKKDVKKAILDKSKKTGIIYRVKTRSGNRRRHQASAPGEAPASISGNLQRSIGFDVKGVDLSFGYRVSAPYGKNLEVGELRGGGSPSSKRRPALEDAINRSEGDFKEFVGRGIHDKVVKKIQGGK